MKKQELTYYEMKARCEKYLFKTIAPSMLGISLLFLGIYFLIIDWKIVGWTTITFSIGSVALAIVFSMVSSYWYRKAFEPPRWFTKWRETHRQ